MRYVTDGEPAVGGVLRQRPEDFIVEEIPAYEPCGSGEHIYLYIQKYNMSTLDMVRLIARHFGVREGDVGYAGLKDKRAVTRQVISIHTPGKTPEDFGKIQHDRLQVLWTDLHTNKLRRGQLKGNRFAIRIRRTPIAHVTTARRVLEALAKLGVPNRAGEQRFGYFQNNHLLGRALVLDDASGFVNELLRPRNAADSAEGPEMLPSLEGQPHVPDELEARARELFAAGNVREAARLMPRFVDAERLALEELARAKGEWSEADARRAIARLGGTRRGFFISALQSAVFNRVLDERMARLGPEGLRTLFEGDVAFKHENGACFAVTSETLMDAATAGRLERLEISPSGPMWGGGDRHMRAAGATDAAEVAALESLGLSVEQLRAYDARVQDSRSGLTVADAMPGSRRPLRVPVAYPSVSAGADEHGVYILCSFELPPGSFATAVLREIMKPERAGALLPAVLRAADARAATAGDAVAAEGSPGNAGTSLAGGTGEAERDGEDPARRAGLSFW